MICIQCLAPTETLYTSFASNYIRLTTCATCGKVADKYIEYDKVMIFIDVMLLKPQAYRHVAFNLVDQELHSPTPYKKVARLVILTVLFEVYLIWVYEERKPVHSAAMAYVLLQTIHAQYGFFIFKLVVEQLFFVVSVCGLVSQLTNFGEEKSKSTEKPQLSSEKDQKSKEKSAKTPSSSFPSSLYRTLVLVVTIFMSSSIKTFPILMLIWPYDRASILLSLINAVTLLNITEALKIIVDCSYVKSLAIVLISSAVQFLFSQLVLNTLLGYCSKLPVSGLLKDEIRLHELNSVVRYIKELKNLRA